MRRLLYANLFTGVPASSTTGEAYTFPKFRPGEQVAFALRFLDEVNGSLVEVERDIAAIRAGVGLVDNPPANGKWALQVGAGASTGANTTTTFNWNQDSAAVETALNSLSGIAPHDFNVSQDGNSWLVWRDSGASFTLTGRTNTLSPTSFIRVRGAEKNGVWINEVRLVQASVAFTDSSDLVLPEAPAISLVRDGGADGLFEWNEIQKLSLPPDFKGTYYLKRGFARTDLLDFNSGITEIKTALDVILLPEEAEVNVTNPSSNVAFIEFRGELRGTNVALLELVVADAPAGDLTFVMDFTTADAWAALRELDNVPVAFEVEVDYYIDPADHPAGTRTAKLWSETVTLGRPLLWEGLAAVQNIDWLRQPSPRSYVPFTTDQIITGSQYYTQAFGNGVATSFTFAHNLATDNIAGVVVRENVAGGAILTTGYTLALDSANSLTLVFSAAPALNARVVIITAAGPTTVFQTHTHTRAQIVGLEDILDDLGSRVAGLEAVLPSTGPGVTDSSTVGMVTLLPKLHELLFVAAPTTGGFLGDKGGVDAAKLPERAPYLLPAIHDSTTDNLTDPLPTISTNAGKVYLNSGGAAVAIPGGGKIPSKYVAAGGFVNCDGRSLYVSRRDGTTKSYYPMAFERTLFTMAVNDKQLIVGRTLEVSFAVLLQMAKALRNQDFFCQAQWVLRLEVGAPTSDTSPATTGLNLAGITWAADPIFEQAIVLDELFRAHAFGVRIQNLLGGIGLDQQLYGNWSGNNAAAPATANFVLRARLHKFDTENNQPLARAFVFLGLAGGLADDGEVTEGAKAVIS